LGGFNTVSLADSGEVKLMNRIDRKYWFSVSLLPELLEDTREYYDILEINGQHIMDYETIYFDTRDDQMYRSHHNKKLNRYKIRKRRYFSTNKEFLEIKLKNNKQRMIKERMESTGSQKNFTMEETEFLSQKSPFDGTWLSPALKNHFQRITLVHKEKTERCTLDFNLKFTNQSGTVTLKNMAVAEIKRSRNKHSSPLLNILREKRIRQRGLSKYCTGRAILEPQLKQNAFKPRLRFIKMNSA